MIGIRKLTPTATLPMRASKFAAGMDLFADEDCTIPARGSGLVRSGISIALPLGTYGRIAPRSGLAAVHFIDIGAGVIDADYRGEIKVLLYNLGSEDFNVWRGLRIAQLICEKIEIPEIIELNILDSTERGNNGFGSTGQARREGWAEGGECP